MARQIDLKMKYLVLLIVCIGWLSCKTKGQISITNIKQESSLKEKFIFSIHNDFNHEIFYYVSLQIWDENNGWVLVEDDLFNRTSSKNIKIFSLPAREKLTHYFYPTEIHPNTIIPKDYLANKKCRLRISFREDLNDNLNYKILNSDSFLFK